MERLEKAIFWISFVLFSAVLLSTIFRANHDEEEYSFFLEKARTAHDPSSCENIKNSQFSSQCYKVFIEQGVQCPPSDTCYIAEAVHKDDELFCDEVFPEKKLPFNLECRVSVFIERYTDEGLRDCCHIT